SRSPKLISGHWNTFWRIRRRRKSRALRSSPLAETAPSDRFSGLLTHRAGRLCGDERSAGNLHAMMSEDLLDRIDTVIEIALSEDIEWEQLRMAMFDRYIDLDIRESGETE